MRTILLGLIAMGIAVPATAQSGLTAGGPTTRLDAWSGSSAALYPGQMIGGGMDTPTMRQQKLAWMIDLRDEAVRLQAADGGVLTDHHARYIRRRLDRIVR